VSRSGYSVERTWIHQHARTSLNTDLSVLREANIIANTQSDLELAGRRMLDTSSLLDLVFGLRLQRRLGNLCRVHLKHGDTIARAEGERLLESDLAGYVNVKEMQLAMLGDQTAGWVKDHACVVELTISITLWNGAGYEVDTQVRSPLRRCDDRRGLARICELARGVRAGCVWDGLCILFEEAVAIRAVEALREHNKASTLVERALDGFVGVIQVDLLVCTDINLAQTHDKSLSWWEIWR